MKATEGPVSGEAVSLEEMLDARERRARAQRSLLARHPGSLVCLTMNIPGPVKVFPLAARCFEEGVRQVEDQLRRFKHRVMAVRPVREATGWEQLWMVDAPAPALKQNMALLEDRCPLGRLWDIDVLGRDGVPVSRTELGLSPRRCFLCGEPAGQCARSRAHPVEELLVFFRELAQGHFEEAYRKRISGCGLRALLHEACTTPKPGLVDTANTGAHRDMDLFSFLDSAAALAPFLEEMTGLGMAWRGDAPETLLEQARFAGMLAESRMLAATGGVNTHKGAIFLLGLLCLAAGHLYGEAWGEAELLARCSRIAGGVWDRDMAGQEQPETAGERFYAQYGIGGARGEAAQGFASVRHHSLPVLREMLEQGKSLNEAGAVALLHLMAWVDDTNLIKRGGRERQIRLQQQLRAVLGKNPAPAVDWIRALDREMIRENLSPGGCADLLSVTYFVHFLDKGETKE